MSLIVSENAGSSIAPIDEGTYPAVCYGLVDLGSVWSEAYGKASEKVMIFWEIPSETIKTEDGEVSRRMSATYTASLNEKANLRKTLESWRGRAFSADELKGFSLRSIVGVPCLLSVIHQEKSTGGKYAKVNSVMKIAKGMSVTGTEPKMIFDFDSATWADDLEALPDWVKERVKESETFKAKVTDSLADDDFGAYNDDIPFGQD